VLLDPLGAGSLNVMGTDSDVLDHAHSGVANDAEVEQVISERWPGKRLVFPFIVLFELALALVSVSPASAGNPKNLAAGTGTIDGFGDPMVHVNAQTNPNTGMTSGKFFIRYPAESTIDGKIFEVGGSVSCLFVDLVGNHAAVAGTIERIKGTAPAIFGPTVIGGEVSINVLDNGSPGTLDEANEGQAPGATNLPDCGYGSTLAIKQGNYTVKADPPLELLTSLDALIADAQLAANCSASVVCSGTGVFILP
jgi:hypothetical protein